MLSGLWDFLRNEDNRGALAFLGGGAAVVIGGIWAVATFVMGRKAGDEQHPLTLLLAKQNAELVQKLLAASPVPAAPGERQAVEEAVAMAAEGAEAEDPRWVEAFASLQAGDVAAAEAQFSAVATEKEQAAASSAEEAARAYRNLGAIAGLRDPQKAHEAYAKAAALDPGDAEGLYWDGWFQLSAKNLAAAEKSYRALARLAGKGAEAGQLFWARNGLGDIAVARGDLNAALVAYGEARAAMERLARGRTRAMWVGSAMFRCRCSRPAMFWPRRARWARR
jgi:tetratricopeptide (TPR) repeat protein